MGAAHGRDDEGVGVRSCNDLRYEVVTRDVTTGLSGLRAMLL
jgi:hypothetical protein